MCSFFTFLPSWASTQINSTSTSIEAEIVLFPFSNKPPTHPPTHPTVKVVGPGYLSPVNSFKTFKASFHTFTVNFNKVSYDNCLDNICLVNICLYYISPNDKCTSYNNCYHLVWPQFFLFNSFELNFFDQYFIKKNIGLKFFWIKYFWRNNFFYLKRIG